MYGWGDNLKRHTSMGGARKGTGNPIMSLTFQADESYTTHTEEGNMD